MKTLNFDELIQLNEAKEKNICDKCNSETCNCESHVDEKKDNVFSKTLNYENFLNSSLFKTDDVSVPETKEEISSIEENENNTEFKEQLLETLNDLGVRISLSSLSTKIKLSTEKVEKILEDLVNENLVEKTNWADKYFYRIK